MMSEIEQKILEALRRLNQEMARVFSYDVASEIDRSPGRTREYLRRLEKRQLVTRGGRQRCGWVAA